VAIPYPCTAIPQEYYEAHDQEVGAACPNGFHIVPTGGDKPPVTFTDSAEWYYWGASTLPNDPGQWYRWRTYSDGNKGPIFYGMATFPTNPTPPSTFPSCSTGPLRDQKNLPASQCWSDGGKLPAGTGAGGTGGTGGSGGGSGVTALPTTGIGAGTTATSSPVTGVAPWTWFALAAIVLWFVAED
jgi:hypothetical protein